MFELLEKYLMGPMTKLSQFKLVRAITYAGMASISFTIVGSMFLIVSILPDVFPFLEGIWAASFDKISNLYMVANAASIGVIAIYFLAATSYEYARILAEDDEIDIKPMNGMLMAFFMLFMMMPQFIATGGGIDVVTNPDANIYSGWELSGTNGIARLGATGIFSAILISWIAVNIYAQCVKHNIVIKLPDVVPDGVGRSFTALVPGFLVAIAAMVIQGVLAGLGTDLYKLISIPFGFVINITGSLPGVWVIYLLVGCLWMVGIHGATIIWNILTPVTVANFAANAEGATNVLAGEFNNAFVICGGSGATLAFTFMLVFLAKSEQLKAIGKGEIVPALFNINEPLIFGLPIVYNPALAIPFIFAPIVTSTIAYLAISMGFIPPVIANMPWPTPVGVGAFISTGGSLMAGVVAVVCTLVAGLIWFPFFKKYDSDLYKQEQEQLAAESEA